MFQYSSHKSEIAALNRGVEGVTYAQAKRIRRLHRAAEEARMRFEREADDSETARRRQFGV